QEQREQEAGEGSPLCTRSPPGSAFSAFSVVPSAEISVRQFEADRRRTYDHCESVRRILRRPREGPRVADRAANLRVTDAGLGVFTVGDCAPRLFGMLRFAVALWTSFHAPYVLAFTEIGQCISWSIVPDLAYGACTMSFLFTAYVDSGMYEIASLPLVLRKRLASPGWYADLLSCLPGCVPALLLLKLVLRLRHVFATRHDSVGILTELPEFFRRSFFRGTLRFTVLRLLLSVYLFAHLLGCLLHAAVKQPGMTASGTEEASGAYVEALKLSMSMMFSGNLYEAWEQGGESDGGNRAVLFYVMLMPLVAVFITMVSAEVILLAQRACVLESQQFERLAMVDEA
ncbi:unnamed protein product, partial [Prorocentrum cordatum]